MSYCTAADVQAANPKRTYSATSTPTLAEVGEFVTQIAGEMDTVLTGRGLTVPVTTPTEFVTFLKKLNIVGAIAMCENAMFPEAVGQMSNVAAERFWKQYRDGIKFLQDGQLPSAAGGDTVGLPFSFFTENLGDEEPHEDSTWRRPKFGKNKEF